MIQHNPTLSGDTPVARPSAPLAEDYLAQVEARTAAAENGWHLIEDRDDPYRFEIHGDGPTRVAVFGGDPDDSSASYPVEENARFAVHARWDVPALLAEVRRLRAVVAHQAKDLAGIADGIEFDAKYRATLLRHHAAGSREVAGLPEPDVQVPGQQEIPQVDQSATVLPGDHFDALNADDQPDQGNERVRAAVRRLGAVVGQGTPGASAPPVFRVGNLVVITGRDGGEVCASSGVNLNGKTGVVAEIDDNPEYPIGLQVEGFVGLVWCSSTEIRHADPATIENGAAR